MLRVWTRRTFEKGNALLLVDGLDELGVAQLDDVDTWLRDIIDTYPQTRVIVTARPHVDTSQWPCLAGFQEAVLQPLRGQDLYQFVTLWHAALKEGVIAEESIELTRLEQALLKRLEENPSLRELATTPLLAALVCALHRDRSEEIPVHRVKLYEACLHMLYRRDRERKVFLEDYVRLTDEQLTSLLSDLALWMQRAGESESTNLAVDSRLQVMLGRMPGAKLQGGAAAVRKLLVERINVLRSPSDNVIDFPHRTFQEYLAAIAAINEAAVGELIRNAHEEQWRETVILAAGIAPAWQGEELIRRLLERGGNESDYEAVLFITAASALQLLVTLQPGSDLTLEVETRLESILPPRNKAQATELAKAGLLVMQHLSYNPKWGAYEAASAIRALALIGGQECYRLIGEYGQDRRSTIADEIHRSFNFTEDQQLYREWAYRRLRHVRLTCDKRSSPLQSDFFSPQLESLMLEKQKGPTDLTKQKKIKRLVIYQSDSQIKGSLSQLRHLTVISSRCSIDQNAEFSALKQVDLYNVDLQSFDRCLGATLTSLSLSRLSVSEWPLIGFQNTLLSLALRNVQVNGLAILGECRKLERLDIRSCSLNSLKDTPPISSLIRLSVVSPHSFSIDDIAKFPRLQEVRCEGDITDIEGVTGLVALNSFSVTSDSVFDFRILDSLPELEYLELPSSRDWLTALNGWLDSSRRSILCAHIVPSFARVRLSKSGTKQVQLNQMVRMGDVSPDFATLEQHFTLG